MKRSSVCSGVTPRGERPFSKVSRYQSATLTHAVGVDRRGEQAVAGQAGAGARGLEEHLQLVVAVDLLEGEAPFGAALLRRGGLLEQRRPR